MKANRAERTTTMLLKPTKPKLKVPAEGIIDAVFEKDTILPDELHPKKVRLDFRAEGYEECVAKELPIDFTDGSLFVKDMEILRGEPFTTAELQAGINPSDYRGAKVRLVVVSRPGAGGKLKSVAGPFTAIPCEGAAK